MVRSFIAHQLVNLRPTLSTDVIAQAGAHFATVLVAPDLGAEVARGVESNPGIPILFLARQERPALQHEDALAARREFVQQRAPARPRADDDNVVVVVHDGSWSGAKGIPYSPSFRGEWKVHDKRSV